MTDFYTKTFTIFCQTPVNLPLKINAMYGFKHVVGKCKNETTYVVQNNKNVNKALIKDIANYLPPTWEADGYYGQPVSEREKYWTLANGDFIVFDEVADVCENKFNASEFNAILDKYALNGMVVENSQAFLTGRPTDHIEGASV